MAEQNNGATYTHYHVERGRYEDPGWRVMPVAGPSPQAPQLVQLHAAVEIEYVAWIASRYGQHPQMPHPYAISNQQSGLEYLGGRITEIVPVDNGGDSHLFVAAGFYLYVRNTTVGLTQPLPLGRLPWEAIAPNSLDIDPSYFNPTLMSDGPGGGQPQLPQDVINPYQGMLQGGGN